MRGSHFYSSFFANARQPQVFIILTVFLFVLLCWKTWRWESRNFRLDIINYIVVTKKKEIFWFWKNAEEEEPKLCR